MTAGRRLGRPALAAGAIGGTIPDLDTLVIGALGPLAEWEYHRGVSHSLFFGPVVGPVLGWLAWTAFRRWRPASRLAAPDALNPWMLLFLLSIVTHPLLDLFTHYGTQLLAPFSTARFAIPAVGIIDPAYTVPLLLVVIAAGVRPAARATMLACAIALTATSGYLFYAWSQNQRAEAEARRQLAVPADVHAYPTLFQPYLRRLTVRDAAGLRVGFVSTWQPGPIAWTCFSRDAAAEAALAAARADRAVRLLDWFAGGQVWPVLTPAGLQLTDLRYGFPGPSITGWWGVAVPRNGGSGERISFTRSASLSAVGAVYAAGFGDVAALYQATGTARPIVLAGSACVPPA